MTTRKAHRRRRFQTRKVLTHVRTFWVAKNKEIKEDLRKAGIDVAKTGLGGILLNTWVRNGVLLGMSIMAFVVGLALWIYGMSETIDSDPKDH